MVGTCVSGFGNGIGFLFLFFFSFFFYYSSRWIHLEQGTAHPLRREREGENEKVESESAFFRHSPRPPTSELVLVASCSVLFFSFFRFASRLYTVRRNVFETDKKEPTDYIIPPSQPLFAFQAYVDTSVSPPFRAISFSTPSPSRLWLFGLWICPADDEPSPRSAAKRQRSFSVLSLVFFFL